MKLGSQADEIHKGITRTGDKKPTYKHTTMKQECTLFGQSFALLSSAPIYEHEPSLT